MASRRTLSARWLDRRQHVETCPASPSTTSRRPYTPYMRKIIISVHVPKTVGRSFAVWLESVFGSGPIMRDNADRPIDPKSEMNIDPAGFLSRHGAARELPKGAQVVHGHFWAKKYERTENAVRIRFSVILSNVPFRITISGETRQAMVTACISVFLTRECECSILLACLKCVAATGITSFATSTCRVLTLLAICRFSMKNWDGLRLCFGVRGARATVGQNPVADYSSMREVALTTGPLRDELAELLADEVAFYRQHLGR
jgi:hypothetical protein